MAELDPDAIMWAHQPRPVQTGWPVPFCRCDSVWPCTAYLLAAEVSRLRQQVKSVESLADEADDRASGAFRRKHGGSPFPAIIGVAEVRAALAVETDQP